MINSAQPSDRSDLLHIVKETANKVDIKWPGTFWHELALKEVAAGWPAAWI